ncbi:carcinoembryonic antigen-related cell adhesion molecule 1-like [Haliotis asinina]|uniref:carcinoembryonic antigen-related cell adhesion molecule 1-like n=1 Tax=Haliotis asinina TaxID=109174 RepID=UPI0035325AE9
MRILKGGSITLEPRNASTIHGNQFTFICHVKAGVQGLVIFKGEISQGTVCAVRSDTGQQTTDSTDYECSHVRENTYALIIRNVSATHLSPWTCQSGGKKSSKVTLDIKCGEVTAANPFPSKFTWYYGGKVVGRDQIYTIPTVYKSTSGLYRCVADNGITPPGEGNVTLDVQYPPTVHIDHTQIFVNESEDLTINCTADAHPEVMSLVWSKEGIGTMTSENGTLYLKYMRKSDSGVYVCTAANIVTTCNGTRQSKQSSRTVTVHVICMMPFTLIFTAGGAAGLVVVVGVIGSLYARREHHRETYAATKALHNRPNTEPSQSNSVSCDQSAPEDRYNTLTDRPVMKRRKLLEAIAIKRNKPSINRDDGVYLPSAWNHLILSD